MTKRSPSIPPVTPPDEIWTMKDGTRIAVGDMEERHVRNALRMVLRQHRKRKAARAALDDLTVGDGQDMLNAEHYRMLANPSVFFPLLDGGVHGSPALQAKYGRR